MILRLCFRVGDAGQMLHELLAGIDPDHLDAQILGEHVHHHVAFAQAQQAVIDEDAGQLVADRAVDQRRRHARIDPAGQPENDIVAADLAADRLHRFGDVIGHVPVRLATADFMHEAGQNCLALAAYG